MGEGEEKTLEELIKLREQLKQDLADLQHEENIVVAAIANPKQQQLINALKDRNKLTEHSKILLKAQNKKIIESKPKEINKDELLKYYSIFTGVTVNTISVKTLPATEDPTDKCCYLYEVDANIENLQFYMSYCTNKPPDKPPQENEIIKQLKIKLAKPITQIEIQDALDFFAEKHPVILTAILFLKSLNKLNIIRRNICKELMETYKGFLNVALVQTTGQLCMICKGVARPTNYFVLYWQIKLDKKSYNSARDSFKFDTHVADKQLVVDIEPVFNNICRYEKWSKNSEKQKLELFQNAISLLVEADSRDTTSSSTLESSISTA